MPYRLKNGRAYTGPADAGTIMKHKNKEDRMKKEVVIEVRGGVAEVTHCPGGDEITIKIIDHDNRSAS